MPPRLPAHGAVQRSVTLAEALGVGAGEVVAFIGAGGKTTAMYRLAADLAARGLHVIVTTTTKILPPDRPDVALLLEGEGGGPLVARIGGAFGRAPVVAVVSRRLADGKLEGIRADAIGALREIREVGAVLVEADGAARKPFKAPAHHEPVIPAETTLLVAVVGADALGQPLSAELAHRPELVAQQAGIRMGDPITPEVVARVLLGRENLRGRPSGARLAALISKAWSPGKAEPARRLARLLQGGGAAPVVLAELAADPPFVALAA